MIIQTLHRYQHQRGGYLTRDDLKQVASECDVPLYRVQELVSFFPHFRTTPPPKVSVHVCRDMACHLRGSGELLTRLEAIAADSADGEVDVCGVSCLGRCDRAPACIINERLHVEKNVEELQGLIEFYRQDIEPPADTDTSHSERSVAQSNDPWQIEIYGQPDPSDRQAEATRDYRIVRSYLASPDPQKVLSALETAGLLGMGGAGGRTYLKWADVLNAEGERKYVVCNADESEPGTFKDREVMTRHPHLLIEGMILAGLVVGAEQGWIYVRHEYPEQIAKLREEIRRARSMRLLGNGLLGTGMSFQLDVYISPGGYICGEQTALIEAMEDKRAEPRNRPPELMTNGYRNQPTLLNNVETFAWVPAIMHRSQGEWFRDEGVKTGPFDLVGQADRVRGRRLFSISGDVAKPGVYEVPTGLTLGELIDRYAGGMRDGMGLAAVALSGPSGGLWPAQIPAEGFSRSFAKTLKEAGISSLSARDLPLDINVSRAMGFMLGGGLVVYGDRCDIVAEALACSRFFRNESCGKCVPCRIGSQKVTEMIGQIARGNVSTDSLPVIRDTIAELGSVMEATSICGLGQVASNPARTLLKFFPDAVAKRCRKNPPDDATTITQGAGSSDPSHLPGSPR